MSRPNDTDPVLSLGCCRSGKAGKHRRQKVACIARPFYAIKGKKLRNKTIEIEIEKDENGTPQRVKVNSDSGFNEVELVQHMLLAAASVAKDKNIPQEHISCLLSLLFQWSEDENF